MKKFLSVFSFEYLGMVSSKPFMIITGLALVALTIVMAFPMLTNRGNTANEMVQPSVQEESGPRLVVVGEQGIEALARALPGYKVYTAANEEEARVKMEEIEAAGVVIITGDLSLRTIVPSQGLTSSLTSDVSDAALRLYQEQALAAHGLTTEQSTQILGAQVQNEVEVIGKSFFSSFSYTYVLLIMLYFAVAMYGQFVSTSVATEKSSRAMELLITSANPLQLIFGKVIGMGLAGLTQFSLMIGWAFGAYRLFGAGWQGNEIIESFFNIPPSIMVYSLVFFILGYFLYAFLYGALGSLVSRVEDTTTATLPVLMLTMAAFMISMIGILNPDTLLMRVSSFIPFFSPMAMFLRVSMTDVPFWEIAVSIALLVITNIGVGVLAAKIYRAGVLMYGKPPKISELIKILKTA